MNKINVYAKIGFFLMLLAILVSGCSSSGGGGAAAPVLSSAKAITAYSLDGVAGTINESAKTISVTMPYGKNVTALVATFTTQGADVKAGTVAQSSGITANNFTTPQVYTVTAADASTTAYTVSVTNASISAREVNAFSLAGTPGIIDEAAKTITVTLPYGVDVTAPVAAFTTTGASVKVGTVTQSSGTTANNFSSPVAYIVTAADGSTTTYTVHVTESPISAKAITAYSFAGFTGAAGVINEPAKTIAVTVPYGTDVTALVATFTTSGSSVKVGSALQTSATTPINFSAPVSYTVTAVDGSTATYSVTVVVAPNSAKTISAYSFAGFTGAAGVINEPAKTIAVTVPNGTNLAALVATFTTSGVGVMVGQTLQTSEATLNNFTAPVAYTVTSADGATVTYTVTVTVAPGSAKAISAYSFAGFTGAAGIINEPSKTIAVTVPNGTNVTALVATFTTSGSSVKVGSALQTSVATPNNFTAPVSYLVTAADGSTATYTVTVTVAPGSAKVMSAYSFAGFTGSAGIVNETSRTIAVTVPNGTNVTALVATFTTTGVGAKVGSAVQTSAATPNNFTSPVTYTITAADGSTASYTVTVSVAPSSAKNITAYSFAGLTGATGVIDDIARTIAVTVPNGTSVTALAATFTTTGNIVKVGPALQTSATTPNDFTSPVIYTVTATDSTSVSYTVTVTVAPAAGPSPVLLGTAGNYVILAKTGVSTVPGSAITGDVGLSPAAATYLTGFSLTMVGTTSAISTQVTGNLYAADMTAPTSTYLTTAVSDMGTAYTDAAGRPTPDVLNLGTGEIGGRTLTPGLYTWTTGVTISSDVVISGGPNDIWIFQIPGNLTMSSAKNITLSGGAKAKNIFWQVAGYVNIGTTAHFEGIILSQTSITFGTGASMNGRALAQTAVILDSSAVTKPD